MKRKFAAVVGPWALVFGATLPTYAQEEVVLRFAHEAPATAIKGRSADKLAELIEQYTDGSVVVEVFPGGQLVPTAEEIRAAVRGQVDIIAPYTSYYSAINPVWDIFYQPLLFDSPAQAIEVFAGPVGQELLANLEENGLKGLSIWHDGPVYAFGTGEPLLGPETYSGQQIRVAPSQPIESMLERLGAVAVSIPATEVYLALQQGVADGVITTPTYAAPAQWHEVLDTMTRVMWGVGGYGLAMNPESWERMSPEQQEGFMRAVRETADWNRAQTIENISNMEAELAANGVEFFELAPEQYDALLAVAQEVWAEQGEEIQALIEQVQAQGEAQAESSERGQ